MTKHWRILATLILVLGSVLALAFSTQIIEASSDQYGENESTPVPLLPTQTAIAVDSEIVELQSRIDHLESLVEMQDRAYGATVQRMESNFNLFLAILAIAALIATLAGFSIIQVWIRNLVEDRIRQMASQEVSDLLDREANRFRQEWDQKFADLYEEYSSALRK